MRLAVSVTNSGLRKVEFPDDPYVVSRETGVGLVSICARFDRALWRCGCGKQHSYPLIPVLSSVPVPENAMFDVDLTDAHVLDLTPNNVQMAANKIQPDARN